MEGVRCLSAKESEDIDALYEYKEYGHDAKVAIKSMEIMHFTGS